MTNQQFQIGTEVQLKSGGPVMVIEKIENGAAFVVWFDKGDVKRQDFPLVVLVPYP